MAKYELHKQMDDDRQEAHHFSAMGEDCIVSNDANAAGDKVEVTFPNSDDPSRRQEVKWWVGVKVVGGELEPRYPQRGDQGAAFQTDSGDLWLMW